MTKFAHWPLWVQIVVAVPHALLAGLVLWGWWPKTRRGYWWFTGAVIYLFVFYFVFVR